MPHDGEVSLRDAILAYREATCQLARVARDGSAETTIRERLRIDLAVLIIEDDPDWPELVAEYLNRNGFRVTCRHACGAVEVEQAMAGARPDVVLCDHTMPAFSSVDALEIVNRAAPGVPFILLSGTLQEEDAAGVMDLGARDYIPKDHLDRLAPAIRRELARVG